MFTWLRLAQSTIIIQRLKLKKITHTTTEGTQQKQMMLHIILKSNEKY